MAGIAEAHRGLARLVEANTLLSGLGFESSGLAAAHAVHKSLTVAPGTHPYLHGEKVAFGLLVQFVLEGSPRATVEQILAFSTEVSLPITPAGIGLRNLPGDLLGQIASPRHGPLARRFTTSRLRSPPTWSAMPSWRLMHGEETGPDGTPRGREEAIRGSRA